MEKGFLLKFATACAALLFIFSCSSDHGEIFSGNIIIDVPTEEFSITIDENPSNNLTIGVIEGGIETDKHKFILINENPLDAIGIIDSTGQVYVKDSVYFNFEINPELYATAKVYRRFINNDGYNEIKMIKKTNIIIRLNDIYEKYSFIGSKILSTQQELEDFGNENHWGISGTLQLSSTIPSDIHDLTPLSSIKNYGSLNIFGLDLITSLNGISIDSLNKSLKLSGNSQLVDIEALSVLSKINKDLIIEHNNSLQSLSGLYNLSEVGGTVKISFHSSLLEINGLGSLQSVSGDLKILKNGLLSNLCGIETLINNKGLKGEYIVEENWYNPTQQDILDGNCSN